MITFSVGPFAAEGRSHVDAAVVLHLNNTKYVIGSTSPSPFETHYRWLRVEPCSMTSLLPAGGFLSAVAKGNRPQLPSSLYWLKCGEVQPYVEYWTKFEMRRRQEDRTRRGAATGFATYYRRIRGLRGLSGNIVLFGGDIPLLKMRIFEQENG